MSTEAIQRLRLRFEVELERNPTLYHRIDVDRVRSLDWQVKRFLVDRDHDEDQAFEALLKALQWKKEFGIHDRTDQYFPKELWELNGIEINGRDRENRVVQWEVYRNQRTFKKIQLLARRFIAHCVERVDQTAGEDGFILVMDMNGAGIANVDLDLIKFKLRTIEHYPCGLRQVLMVDVPERMIAVIKIIVSYMKPKVRALLTDIQSGEIEKFLQLECVPVWLGGKREKQAFPENLIPLEQCAEKLELTEKFVNSLYNFYRQLRLSRCNP